MIGSLIGAGIGAIGSIFGGISASKAMKKYYNEAKDNIDTQRDKNDSWYSRRYNESATQRADARDLLTRTEEAIRERNKEAAGMAAVGGATAESIAAAKAANNAAMANTVASIAANADARKDSIERQYMSRDAELTDKMTQLSREKNVGKAQAVAQAVQGVTSAAGNFGTALDDWRDSRLVKSNEQKPEG